MQSLNVFDLILVLIFLKFSNKKLEFYFKNDLFLVNPKIQNSKIIELMKCAVIIYENIEYPKLPIQFK